MTSHRDRRSCTLDWLVAHPTMPVRRWCDPTVEGGFDARDVYVERFWLPVLGPSAVLALRRLADWLDEQPSGVEVDLVEFASSLGVGAGTGRHTQINRTLARLIDFGAARIHDDHLEVHTALPPLPQRLWRRLPLSLLDELTDQDRHQMAGRSMSRAVGDRSPRPAPLAADHPLSPS